MASCTSLSLSRSVCVCVLVVPHVTDAIQEWVERVAQIPVDDDERRPDICIIEVRHLVYCQWIACT